MSENVELQLIKEMCSVKQSNDNVDLEFIKTVKIDQEQLKYTSCLQTKGKNWK